MLETTDARAAEDGEKCTTNCHQGNRKQSGNEREARSLHRSTDASVWSK